MTTVYPKPFLDEFDLVDRSFHYPKNPNAKQERDTLARELRKAGWDVKTKKWTFHGDLCSGESYTIYATRKKHDPETEWLWYGSMCSLAHMATAEQAAATG
ncbi:MAG: hypothetical protein M0Q91_18195 [Methanoregula sp.]|jgi:hypothetical protein|nr:hypothetical protein [Methanoregula sp.]